MGAVNEGKQHRKGQEGRKQISLSQCSEQCLIGAWLEILGGKERGQRSLVGRGEFPRLTAVIPFILWRPRHLHDRRAEEIL